VSRLHEGTEKHTTARRERSRRLSLFLDEEPLAKKGRARKPSRAELKNNKRADQSLCQLSAHQEEVLASQRWKAETPALGGHSSALALLTLLLFKFGAP